MKILDTKVVKDGDKSTAYILIEDSKTRWSIVTYTSYAKWTGDGKTYHMTFLEKNEAQKFFDNAKGVTK